MHKTYGIWHWLVITALCFISNPYQIFGWGTNNRADPFPLYTTVDQQEFLQTRNKEVTHGWPLDKAPPERVSLSLTGFGQAANSARTSCGSPISPNDGSTCEDIAIGDLDGRWNMIALLYGPLPQGASYPPLLLQARQALFPGVSTTTPISDVSNIDPDEMFGFFSNWLTYRKFGLRWNFEARLIGDFGFQFQGGVADLRQTLTARRDLTSCTTGTLGCLSPTITATTVIQYLMDPVEDIAKELCLDICSYHAVSVEDLYFCLFWRHEHEINFKRDPSWARFLLIPFIRIAGSAPTGRPKDPAVLFSLPFTNNGHASINANFGINLDFTETIEFGGEIAYSHFFARDICNLHIPNSTYQSGIFPFATTVNFQPGDTWYAAAKINAYHFLDRLSAYAQWVVVKHREDRIRLIDCDPAFITAQCPRTTWMVQLINTGFTYDVSPNIGVGFAWQFPIKWANAYKSNTVLFSFVATF